jgi:hypothetical protein
MALTPTGSLALRGPPTLTLPHTGRWESLSRRHFPLPLVGEGWARGESPQGWAKVEYPLPLDRGGNGWGRYDALGS